MENALYISRAGVLFFAISERYLIHWWDTERHGAPLGSMSTWHSSLILLIHFGLLGRIIASDGSVIDNFRSVYEHAVTKGYRVENILYVPTYTQEILQTAEQLITQQRQVSTLSGVTKTAIILSSGQDAANRLYLDGRRIPSHVAYTLHDMIVRVTKTVEHQGYITKDALLKASSDYMIRHYGYRRTKEKQEVRLETERIWVRFKRTILSETGMTYRRPSADEKVRYALHNDRWIITTPRNAE